MFAVNLVAKLGLDFAGVVAGQSLLTGLGLTLLGEAAVIWFRIGGANQLTSAGVADSRRLHD